MQYTKGTIEFLTVTSELCHYLERVIQEDIKAHDFVETTVKLLPLLYLKATLVTLPEQIYEEEPESFTSEQDYEQIRAAIEELFGAHDTYLNSFHPDMALSDTLVASFISEDLADLYQVLRDFVYRCQIGDDALMNDALAICITDFRQYWGGKLLNALRALHVLYSSEIFLVSEE